jgi:hypothetical protein
MLRFWSSILVLWLILDSCNLVLVDALIPDVEILAMTEIFNSWPSQLTGLGWTLPNLLNACNFAGIGCTDGRISGL